MNENITKFLTNKIPSSAKIKATQIPINISFFQTREISHPKSQCKRKTCKEKTDEDNNNKIKKSISLNHSNNITNEKSKNSQIYNYSNIKTKFENKYIIQNGKNYPLDNISRNQFNEQKYYNNDNNNISYIIKSRNENNEKYNNIKQIKSDFNDLQSKSCKDKKIIPVKNKKENILYVKEIQKNINEKIPFMNYKNNYENFRRNNIKLNENNSMGINYNNVFHNINYINNNNKKTENFSFSSPNEGSTNETQNLNQNTNNISQTTSKIDGKTKKIYNNIDYFNNNNKDLDNINEFISLENINAKLDKKIFSKTLNHFQYKKPIINNRNSKPLDNKEEKKFTSKSNNKTSRVKNVFIKNRAPNNIIINNSNNNNNNLYVKNKDNSYNYNNNENNINRININNVHRETHIKQNIGLNKFNNYINTKIDNNKINSLDSKFKKKKNFETEILTNFPIQIDNLNLNPPKFENVNDLSKIKKDNNLNAFQNIIYNDNKNIYIQNNYINENLNNSYNKNKIISNEPSKKNHSYDLANSKIKSIKNTIKSLKNNINLRKNGIANSDKINKYNIKDILLNNINNANNIKTNEVPELKESNIDKKNEIIVGEKKENEETTLIEESIIVNDSDVYGTLTLKNTINNNNANNKAKDNKEKVNKDNNIDNNNNKNMNMSRNNKNNINITNSYNNNNCRETITIKYADNINNGKENTNKIKIEDLLKDKINLQRKVNENVLNKTKNNIFFQFKDFYSMTNAGKNFGAKKTNQDMPVAVINLNGVKGFNIFGVLDGHGVNGHHVSKFLSDYLVKQIINHREISKLKELDKIYYTLKKSNYELLINLFMNSDVILGKQNFDVNFSGTTCVLVIQVGRNIICANVGDSRAILVYDRKNDINLNYLELFELSHDCKPDLPYEKERIIRMGGTVDQMLDINGIRCGPQRVWAKNKNFPGLAMSRSLGDFQGKRCGIIPVPEFIEYKLDEKCKYIVICSDGVWEFLSNTDVMKIGKEFYLKNNIMGYAQKLVQVSEELWEKKDVIVDDITTVIIFF